jgi:CheY-like chemotaxis protein
MPVKATVLLVEDETFVLMHVATMLEDYGYEVLTATHGGEALTALAVHAARMGALVTDIRLPGGSGGWQIARRARELRPDLPVVYISGDGARDWPVQGVPHSVMLAKPFSASELIEALASLSRVEA